MPYHPLPSHLDDAKTCRDELEARGVVVYLKPDGTGGTACDPGVKITAAQAARIKAAGPLMREYIRWETLTTAACQTVEARKISRRYAATRDSYFPQGRWFPTEEEVASHAAAIFNGAAPTMPNKAGEPSKTGNPASRNTNAPSRGTEAANREVVT